MGGGGGVLLGWVGGGGGGGWWVLTWVLLVGLALGDGRVVAGEDAGDKLWSFLEKQNNFVNYRNKQNTLTVKCIEPNYTVYSTLCT